MTKVKTYWDDIKDKETFYSGGSQGWEVHLKYTNVYTYNSKTHVTKESKRLQFHFPFSTGDGVSREEKSLTRKEVTFKRKKEKLLAQASRNREEYRDLVSRVKLENWDDIVALKMTGFTLGQYIREKYLTYNEAHSLFYRM
jgi:hypothetical protein